MLETFKDIAFLSKKVREERLQERDAKRAAISEANRPKAAKREAEYQRMLAENREKHRQGNIYYDANGEPKWMSWGEGNKAIMDSVFGLDENGEQRWKSWGDRPAKKSQQK